MILPRLVRFRDAPTYVGMDRNRFNREVRPSLVAIPIGAQGLAFDRLELDAWVDDYKSRNGRPGRPQGGGLWGEREHRALSNGTASGTSTNASAGGEFARAVGQLTSRRRSGSLPD
jgi:hypothetical protein